jgi:hypothetical protein
MWIPEIKLMLSGLVASDFIHWALSPAPHICVLRDDFIFWSNKCYWILLPFVFIVWADTVKYEWLRYQKPISSLFGKQGSLRSMCKLVLPRDYGSLHVCRGLLSHQILKWWVVGRELFSVSSFLTGLLMLSWGLHLYDFIQTKCFAKPYLQNTSHQGLGFQHKIAVRDIDL